MGGEGREDNLFCLTTCHSPTREVKAGNKARTWRPKLKQRSYRKKYCLKACSLRHSRFDFLYHPRSPAQGWHSGLGSPHLLSIKKIPTDMPTDQSYGDIFSNRIPSSQTCLGLCQVKKPTSTSGNLGLESRPTNRRDQILLGGDSTQI